MNLIRYEMGILPTLKRYEMGILPTQKVFNLILFVEFWCKHYHQHQSSPISAKPSLYINYHSICAWTYCRRCLKV